MVQLKNYNIGQCNHTEQLIYSYYFRVSIRRTFLSNGYETQYYFKFIIV